MKAEPLFLHKELTLPKVACSTTLANVDRFSISLERLSGFSFVYLGTNMFQSIYVSISSLVKNFVFLIRKEFKQFTEI